MLAISFSALPAQAKYGGGTGEPNEPYLIFDANQMNAIGADSNDWDKHFVLINDVNLAEYTGTSFNIIGTRYNPFTGVFDGNDHTISNFSYTFAGRDYTGLFGYVSDANAEIRYLRLIDPNVDAGTGNIVGSLVGSLREGKITGCYVEGGSISGIYGVGGLVGDNGGTINNCYSTGRVWGDWSVGGLVGLNYDGTITNCYSTGSVSGNGTVGGLAGYNWAGTINNCYASGDVSGGDDVGGLVGQNLGDISDCYSQSDVSGTYYIGGLVGKNGYCKGSWWCKWVPGRIVNSYSSGSVPGVWPAGGLVGYSGGRRAGVMTSFWDIESSGKTISDGGTGLPTAEMQMMSTFTDVGWDFTTPVWTIDESVDYPRLWWELTPVLHAEPEVTLGTSNTIFWDPVPGANDYYAECAEDSNFTSILYNTGWITEISYEFTGLELGQVYWYSAKARNTAGVESGWSNVESSLQGTLADAADIMLDPDTLKNKNMKNALLNKINAAQQMLDAGRYEEALNKLQNDILAKTNGCVETGQPDRNDWIITCEGQSQLYPLVIETIEYVSGLMD